MLPTTFLNTFYREQDAIESGLIKKVILRKSDSGTIPADGDMVRMLAVQLNADCQAH